MTAGKRYVIRSYDQLVAYEEPFVGELCYHYFCASKGSWHPWPSPFDTYSTELFAFKVAIEEWMLTNFRIEPIAMIIADN